MLLLTLSKGPMSLLARVGEAIQPGPPRHPPIILLLFKTLLSNFPPTLLRALHPNLISALLAMHDTILQKTTMRMLTPALPNLHWITTIIRTLLYLPLSPQAANPGQITFNRYLKLKVTTTISNLTCRTSPQKMQVNDLQPSVTGRIIHLYLSEASTRNGIHYKHRDKR